IDITNIFTIVISGFSYNFFVKFTESFLTNKKEMMWNCYLSGIIITTILAIIQFAIAVLIIFFSLNYFQLSQSEKLLLFNTLLLNSLFNALSAFLTYNTNIIDAINQFQKTAIGYISAGVISLVLSLILAKNGFGLYSICLGSLLGVIFNVSITQFVI